MTAYPVAAHRIAERLDLPGANGFRRSARRHFDHDHASTAETGEQIDLEAIALVT
ncbi:MAG: hypothetical protein IPM29_27495 [Planctomycetes bacterium]|nr:hypothetical protein [Planctomycetota bacterium]